MLIKKCVLKKLKIWFNDNDGLIKKLIFECKYVSEIILYWLEIILNYFYFILFDSIDDRSVGVIYIFLFFYVIYILKFENSFYRYNVIFYIYCIFIKENLGECFLYCFNRIFKIVVGINDYIDV